MKRISKWGQRHPMAARIIIVICHLLITTNGLLAGLYLFINDWQYASYTMPLLIFSFVLLFCLYPKRGYKSGPFKYSYRRQKTHDFGLVIFGFLMISVGTNNWLVSNIGNVSTAVPTATFIVHKQKKPSKRQFKKQLRKELRAMKKAFKKRKQKKEVKFIKILLTMLFWGGIIALGFLIGMLSCGLECSGNVGLAALVSVGGAIGITLLIILFHRKVWPKDPKYKTD